jgi:hypothetical protein
MLSLLYSPEHGLLALTRENRPQGVRAGIGEVTENRGARIAGKQADAPVPELPRFESS